MRTTNNTGFKEVLLEPLLRRLRLRMVIRLIPNKADLLDIGCGNGALLEESAGRIADGVGIDMKGGRFARKSLPNIRYEDWLLDDKLNFPDNSFDVVTLLAVLEHLAKPQDIANEIYRVLKPGGRVLLTAPSHAAKPILEFLSFKLNIVSREEILDHKRYFWNREIGDMLRRAGFADQNITTRYFQFGVNNFAMAIK